MINLLPEAEQAVIKKELKIKIRSCFLFCCSIFLISLFLIVAIFDVYWLGEKEDLKIEFNSLSKAISHLENSSSMKEKERIEKNLSIFEKNLESQTYFYSFLLKPLSQVTPASIYFKSLSVTYSSPFSKKKKKNAKKNERKLNVSLTGYAPNRIILLELKENLERADWVTDFYFPPSNWIEDKDINFYLRFNLK